MMRVWLTFTLLLWGMLCHAALTLQLESTKVPYGQTFRITLSSDSSQPDGIPDLTPLQRDFTIAGTQRSINYSSVNGQTQVLSQWSILLLPKRIGLLTIPVIHYGNERTTERTIQVTEAQYDNQDQGMDESKPVLLESEVSVEQPYVNQQVIYTIKLFNNRQLFDADYQAPQVENALLIPLGEGQRYQAEVKGSLYVVEEHQYAIFPQKSGKMTISPPTFQGLIADTVPRQVNVRARPLTLDVKPVPFGFEDGSWLPAKNVVLSERYDSASSPLYPGDTLTREVTIEATGAAAQLLPRLDFIPGEGMSVYPEKPAEKTDFISGNLVGKTTIKVTYLVNQSGELVIPELKLPWFDIQKGEHKTAVLPEKKINVAQADGQSASGVSNLTAKPAQSDKPDAKPAQKQLRWVTLSESTGWWLAGVLALAWLLTVILWLIARNKRPSNARKSALKSLRIACMNNQPQHASAALIAWAKTQWPHHPVINLAGVMQLAGSSDLAREVKWLSEVLYQVKGDKLWQGGGLWRAVIRVKNGKKVRKNRRSPLPPMNP